MIRVSDAPESEDAVGKEMDTRPAMPDGVEQALQEALSFQYAYDAATRAPSKQTATNRKGRAKDEEAAEDTQEPKFPTRDFRRRPSSQKAAAARPTAAPSMRFCNTCAMKTAAARTM